MIREHENRFTARHPPMGLDFSDLMDRISGDRSVNHLVTAELLPITRRFRLPDVQASMISRMRKNFNPNTRAKQNLLRVIAFWIGLNRPYWGWNFLTLMEMKKRADPQSETDQNAGVRIAFQVTGRGDVLSPEAVEWLKGELMECMKSLEMFYIDPRQVTSAATTVFVNIPRLKGYAGDLTLYSRALRNGMALAHQMLIRWNLNSFSGLGSHIVIAIAAGGFTDLDMFIQAMLKARLSEEDLIRMTPFVHLCANLSEIKVVFRHPPREVRLYDGETLRVWCVNSLWSHIYYDFVPPLVKSLPGDSSGYRRFKKSLAISDVRENPVLASVYKHLENSLLIIEIAKTCLAKGMFHEADGFISILLAIHPFHVVARAVRMIIRLNIALYQPEFSAARISFAEAVNEGEFIIEKCRVEDEEVFCELGQVYLCLARRMFSMCRKTHDEAHRKTLRDEVMKNLTNARRCFEKGRTISPSGKGKRSLHWCFRICAVQRVLEADEQAFAAAGEDAGVLTDRFDIFRQTAMEFFCSLGWAQRLPEKGKGYSPEEEAEFFEHIFQSFQLYDNAVLLKTYAANIKYAFAVLVFDFTPRLTVGLLKMVLTLLDESKNQAHALDAKTSDIRTIVNCYSQIQPARTLLERIGRADEYLRSHYKDELALDDDHSIERGREVKFTLINFCEAVFADETMRPGFDPP